MSPAQQEAEAALRAEGQRMLREIRSIFTWCLRVEEAPEGAEVAAPGPDDAAALSDAAVRRVLRFAVGAEMAKTQGGLELALGQADADEVKQLLEQLIQITDDGVISFKQLLEPVRQPLLQPRRSHAPWKPPQIAAVHAMPGSVMWWLAMQWPGSL